MSEIYRKAGRVVRWENGVVVRVVESGIAIDDGETFTCRPDPQASALPPHAETVSDVANRIRAIVAPHAIERLIVAEGEAEHDCDGRQWSERSERIHLAIGHRFRVLIDQASFDLGEIESIARALDRLAEGATPRRLRLAPNVAAALVSQSLLSQLTEVLQKPGGVDGKGFPIVETPGSNWYRPSYRVRPLRVPMHLAPRCHSHELEDAPRAIALLAPPHGPTLHVLIDDGRKAWPATIRITPPRAVGTALSFYPYGAGSFGGEMML
ncbi:MAG TPA: hypothetical protein VGF48_05070 [Thermoanaerobaculia bacterium]|jgi:hypothetical protein